MKKFNYCGTNVSPRTQSSNHLSDSALERLRNPFNQDDREYMSLEDRIRLAMESGADIGARCNPVYDGNDTNDLNILASFKHDVMDIAEHFGVMVDAGAPPQSESAPDAPKTE